MLWEPSGSYGGISSLRCSALRWWPSRLGRRSSLLSPCCGSRRMRVRWVLPLALLFCTSLLWLLLPSETSAAFLQVTDTPTPTATWEPLYKTPTPAPTKDSRCCEGAPEGWGTCTPAADWMANCAQCAPVPTSEFIPAMTWVPSLTPQPTPTPWIVTPTPTFTYTLEPTATYTPSVTETPIATQEPHDFIIYYPWGYDVEQGGCRKVWYTYGDVTAPPDADPVDVVFHRPEDWEYEVINIGGTWASFVGHTDMGDYDAGETFPLKVMIEVNCGYERRVLLHFYRVGVKYHGLEPTPDPTGTPTPTPTPTPVLTPTVTPTPFVGGYCCAVQCSEGDDWEGTIPTVLVGQGTCLEWGGADLSAVGLDPIPPVRICFAPIRFGDVGILGVSVNMDLISVVLSAVVTLRLLWRS